MTNQEAIASLKTLCHTCELFPKCVNDKPECYQAIELAISALEVQESSQNVPNGDFILRKAAIDELEEHRALFCDHTPLTFRCLPYGDKCRVDERDMAIATLMNLPSAQPEPSIPISWIEKHVDWLKNMDNEFANLTAMNISTMVKKWKKEQENNDGSD